MTNEGAQPSALLEGPDKPAPPDAPLIVRVARAHGVSPFRQLRELTALRFGPHKLRPKDYYDFQLYAPEMPMAEKKTYVGNHANRALNLKLSPLRLIPTGAFIANKLYYTMLLKQMGLATTETQAVVSEERSYARLPVLRSAEALKHFLENDAVYPIFGKPRTDSLSRGSIRIEGVEDGMLLLGNGKTLGIDKFCQEVWQKYSRAYLLQTALDPHPEIARITGSSVGCVRLVTVRDTGEPRPLYAVWKIPAPDAMSDNFWQSGSMISGLDLETGKVLSCRAGKNIDTQEVTEHPVSGLPVTGMTLPYWEEAKKLAVDAHALFPEFGVCGFDMAICEDGPKIIECNDSPHHTLYQLANRRGIMTEEFMPEFDRITEAQKKRLPKKKADRMKLYKKAD